MSALETALQLQFEAMSLPAAEREYRFCPGRRWRFDFAWPGPNVACEVEGGIWTAGRHNRGAGFAADCEKYNAAALAGWRVLRVTAGHVAEGRAAGWVQEALGGGSHGP